MNIVLEITSGSSEGKRFWVREGQELTVGSSHQADCSLADDSLLRPFHFSIEHKDSTCLLKVVDNASTYVNREPTHRAVLQNSDLIRAGNTVFRVRIEQAYRAPRRVGVPMPSGSMDSGSLLVPETDSNYRQQTFDNDTSCFIPTSEDFGLEAIVQQLQRRFALYLIVNKQAFGWSVDRRFPELKHAHHLLPHVSFLPLGGERPWDSLQPYLDANAVCLIAAQQPGPDPRSGLSHVAVSFSRPNLFEAQVRAAPSGFVDNLFAAKEAVLTESSTSSWNLYTRVESETDWRRFGFANPPKS